MASNLLIDATVAVDMCSNDKKRQFSVAFPNTECEVSPKKDASTSPALLSQMALKESNDDISDIGALLLVAFANRASSIASNNTAIDASKKSTEWKSYPVRAPSSPSEDCPSDSGSDTLSHHRPRTSYTSDGEYDSEEYEDSESETSFGDKSKSGCSTRSRSDADSTSENLGRRLRVGQHYSKRRHRTTAEQLRVLEMTYAGNKVPNQELRKDLSVQLGMTTRRVQIWFQNKRAKEKRMRLDLQQKGGIPAQSLATGSSSTASSNPTSPTPETAALRKPISVPAQIATGSPTSSTAQPNPLLFLRNEASGGKSNDLNGLFKTFPGLGQQPLWVPSSNPLSHTNAPNSHIFYPSIFGLPTVQMPMPSSNNPSMLVRQPVWGLSAPLH